MPQSLSRIWLHIVFSTKERRPYFKDEGLRDEMWRMLAHHAGETGCPCARAGGWIDHVHILCGLSRTVTVAQLVETLKTETSKWGKQRTGAWRGFYWQNGYGAFSVSQSQVEQVMAYIDNQPEHHRVATFQDEFRTLCTKYAVEINERYVWD